MRRSIGIRFIPFALAGVVAFTVWAASPAITGRAEPWDADWPFYLLAAVSSGAALGFAFSGDLLRLYLGSWFGQLVAMAALPGLDRGWFLLGVFTAAFGSVSFLVGAAIGSLLRKLLRPSPAPPGGRG